MAKETLSIVRFDSNGLKQDAKIQGQQLVNCCLQGLEHATSEMAKSAIHKLFDYLIDQMNAKLFA